MTVRPHPLSWLSAVVLAGCAFEPTGGATEDAAPPPIDGDVPPPIDGDVRQPTDGAPTGTRFRKAISIAAGTVDELLADFPLYVELTDADLAARAGTGIHFVDGGGTTALAHEVQAWDPATGHLEAWVRLPTLAATARTTIYLRYGAFASPPAANPAAVWQNGYAAVWHLDGAPGGGTGDIDDARGMVDATSRGGMNAASRVDAVLGRGLRFDGSNDELTFTNPLAGATAHTISAWVDQETVNHNSALVVLGTGACAQARWLHSRFTGGPAAAGFYCDDWTSTGVDVVGDGWTLVHWTYAAGTSRMYRDGELVAGPFSHMAAPATQGTEGRIGNAPAAFGNPMTFLGRLDEVRIARVARSEAWIAAEYANQREPASFYTVGAEEAVP